MNTELDFSFLEEGFCAKDIVEQKIKESSMTVNVPRRGLIPLFVRAGA